MKVFVTPFLLDRKCYKEPRIGMESMVTADRTQPLLMGRKLYQLSN